MACSRRSGIASPYHSLGAPPQPCWVWELSVTGRSQTDEQACIPPRVLGLVPAAWFGIAPNAARRHGPRKLSFCVCVSNEPPRAGLKLRSSVEGATNATPGINRFARRWGGSVENYWPMTLPFPFPNPIPPTDTDTDMRAPSTVRDRCSSEGT